MKKYRLILAGILILTLLAVAAFVLSRAEAIITSAGQWAYLLYVLLIIVEVVLAPIPGGILALLGAAYFGFIPAWPLNYLGNIIGALIAFALARKFGKPFVDRLIYKQTQDKYSRFVNAHPVALCLVYAIPILPIDVLSLLLGLSHVSFRRFGLISALGLISYSGILAYLGSRFGTHIPFLEEVTVVAVLFLFGAGIVWWARAQP